MELHRDATRDWPVALAENPKARPAAWSPDGLVPEHDVVRCIGQGSYGEVWLARHDSGEYRALKIVHRHSFRHKRPFERELSGIRKFQPVSRSHAGLIHLLHIGISEQQDFFYYTMELGDDEQTGQSIDPYKYNPRTLAREIFGRRKLSIYQCLQLGLDLSLALSELHNRGLVHRDVKPSNIIYVNGTPKLADIGLLADVDEALSYVGTSGFIAPEGPGTEQGDVFSLGKVLYEASTGKDRQDFPELPSRLDALSEAGLFLELNEIIVRACRNDVRQRYPSAWAMYADLLLLANGESIRRLNKKLK